MKRRKNEEPRYVVLACAALVAGVFLGGYPNYSLEFEPHAELLGAIAPSATSQESGAAAAPPQCLARAGALVKELADLTSARASKPLHRLCERSSESFFAAGVASFAEAINAARGAEGATCVALSPTQRRCVESYASFVDSQMQSCLEVPASLQQISLTKKRDLVDLLAGNYELRSSYCRCVAGALHASVSWITTSQPEPPPQSEPYPFGEGCGVVLPGVVGRGALNPAGSEVVGTVVAQELR